jgi:hypothetical protein
MGVFGVVFFIRIGVNKMLLDNLDSREAFRVFSLLTCKLKYTFLKLC